MALRSQSLFLYGFQVTENNQWIDFKISGGGPELSARLTLGYYSLTGLLLEIARAMNETDPTNTYGASADRTINGGTENRVTISTSGAFLSILFLTGTHGDSSVEDLIGFLNQDYTGSTTYTGSLSAGTLLMTEKEGFTYTGPEREQKVFGAVNVSASGIKEAIVFSLQGFIEVMFQYEPEEKVNTEWKSLFEWLIKQRPFDFTPEIEFPSVFFDVTLESTPSDSMGLAYKMTEMLPQLPFQYSTGSLKMRVRIS